MILNTQNNIDYYTFENLTAAGGTRHLFSTRHGGASAGEWESMNLSGLLGDDPSAVAENFRRIAQLGFPLEDMVFSQQTHESRVRVVTAGDRGKGIAHKRDYRGIDGLVTRDPNVTLVTFYADCVPLYFYDPAQGVIGLSHAGWRGTVGEIGVRTIEAMADACGSKLQDILVGIGPSICKDCFEVGSEVVDEFTSRFEDFIAPCATYPDKSYIDLQGVNRQSLVNAGIPFANIELPGICTKENPNTFFSHRVMGSTRGSLAAFLRLTS